MLRNLVFMTKLITHNWSCCLEETNIANGDNMLWCAKWSLQGHLSHNNCVRHISFSFPCPPPHKTKTTKKYLNRCRAFFCPVLAALLDLLVNATATRFQMQGQWASPITIAELINSRNCRWFSFICLKASTTSNIILLLAQHNRKWNLFTKTICSVLITVRMGRLRPSHKSYYKGLPRKYCNLQPILIG